MPLLLSECVACCSELLRALVLKSWREPDQSTRRHSKPPNLFPHHSIKHRSHKTRCPAVLAQYKVSCCLSQGLMGFLDIQAQQAMRNSRGFEPRTFCQLARLSLQNLVNRVLPPTWQKATPSSWRARWLSRSSGSLLGSRTSRSQDTRYCIMWCLMGVYPFAVNVLEAKAYLYLCHYLESLPGLPLSFMDPVCYQYIYKWISTIAPYPTDLRHDQRLKVLCAILIQCIPSLSVPMFHASRSGQGWMNLQSVFTACIMLFFQVLWSKKGTNQEDDEFEEQRHVLPGVSIWGRWGVEIRHTCLLLPSIVSLLVT